MTPHLRLVVCLEDLVEVIAGVEPRVPLAIDDAVLTPLDGRV
jgi:hypothetical protein